LFAQLEPSRASRNPDFLENTFLPKIRIEPKKKKKEGGKRIERKGDDAGEVGGSIPGPWGKCRQNFRHVGSGKKIRFEPFESRVFIEN